MVQSAVTPMANTDVVIGKMSQFGNQNLTMATMKQNSQTVIIAITTRRMVIVFLYCKWRVKARSRSTQTPLRVKKDTPEVIQPVKYWIIRTLQYSLKFSKSSATLYATNEGWPTSPTRKSETAKQNIKAKDGVWSSRVFQITSMTMKFPSNAVRAKRELIAHTHTTLAVASWLVSVWCPSKKKHVTASDEFMMDKFEQTETEWFSIMTHE